MTSIHFVVHPLPGTEDQLNDRYFVAARGKEEFKSIFVCGGRYILLEVVFANAVDIVIRMYSGFNNLNDPPGLKQGPASCTILVSLLLPKQC